MGRSPELLFVFKNTKRFILGFDTWQPYNENSKARSLHFCGLRSIGPFTSWFSSAANSTCLKVRYQGSIWYKLHRKKYMGRRMINLRVCRRQGVHRPKQAFLKKTAFTKLCSPKGISGPHYRHVNPLDSLHLTELLGLLAKISESQAKIG